MSIPISDVLDTLPYGSMIIDSNNKIDFANHWILNHMSIEADKMIGKSLDDFVQSNPWVSNQIELSRTQHTTVVLSQKLHSYLIPIPLPPNHMSGYEFMQQEVVIVPIRNRKGRLHITIRDVTAVAVGDAKLKALHHELEEGKNKAEEELERKSAFLAMMSHDIRTPMNGVLGYADLLGVTELSETQTMYLDVIRSSGNMLLNLIGDILDFSKMEAGKLKIEPELFTIRRAVREVIDIFIPEAKLKSISLAVDIDESVPIRFFQDRLRFKQVITNLLSNAVKFTQKGYVMLKIRCEIDPEDGKICLNVEVKDTGPGIPEKEQEHLFDEFFQTVSNEQKANGTGLGLSICRRLCQLMDGEISMESEEGSGSSFSFQIRCNPDKIAPILSM